MVVLDVFVPNVADGCVDANHDDYPSDHARDPIGTPTTVMVSPIVTVADDCVDCAQNVNQVTTDSANALLANVDPAQMMN